MGSREASAVARSKTLAAVVLLALLVCNLQTISAQSSSSSSTSTSLSVSASSSSGSGGKSGAGGLLGTIAGGLAGAQAGAEAGSNASSSAGASGQLQIQASLGGSSSSSSGSASASDSISAGSSGVSASGSDSLQLGPSSTPKPEGLLGKVKDILKESKDIVKSSMESLTKDDSKPSVEASASLSGSSGSVQASGGVSIGGSSSSPQSSSSFLSSSSSLSSSSLPTSAPPSLQAQALLGDSTPKPEGLIDVLSEMARRGKETARELKEDIKAVTKPDGGSSVGSGASLSGSGSLSGGSGSGDGFSASANGSHSGGSGGSPSSADLNTGRENGSDKLQRLVSKGTEAVHDTLLKFEDVAGEVGDKVSRVLEENVRRPMAEVKGSGRMLAEGRLMPNAAASANLTGTERERYLVETRRRQEGELGRQPSLREIIADAKARGIIPRNEDRSVLRGNHADEKSVALEVLDKLHEISKIPVESMLRPLDKALGYEKDPLIRMYDNTHELLRRPVGLIAKPVESVMTGAFKTTDETKRDNERLLATGSELDRREARLKEEKARKENRSVAGSIADRTMELAEKPVEIFLRPVDHLLGFDKDGRRNPMLQLIDQLYNLSKGPLDSIAKPLEAILRKMADGPDSDQYQLSVRNDQERDSADPKLFTRLADGAMNIADRVLTKSFELVMKPLNHVLGYDDPGKRNPIVDAAHSLKNATRLGLELFTRPIDRIVKEIADLGDIRNEAEIEQRYQEASRLVRVMDKIHELAQAPWQIVLRPVGKILGTSQEGRREPILRAWDAIHEVLRTPVQVVSKPVEDALLGEQPRRAQAGVSLRAEAKIGSKSFESSLGGSTGAGPSRVPSQSAMARRLTDRRNLFVEGIKKVERFYGQPLEVITSPIRRMILGEDDEKVGSETDKSNRAIQARARAGAGNGQTSGANRKPDKIIRMLEKMNNVVLRPFELVTQPISDILTSNSKSSSSGNNNNRGQKQLDVRIQGQASGNSQQDKPQQQQPQMSASASAQFKRSWLP